jgi:hypothetical protein
MSNFILAACVILIIQGFLGMLKHPVGVFWVCYVTLMVTIFFKWVL